MLRASAGPGARPRAWWSPTFIQSGPMGGQDLRRARRRLGPQRACAAAARGPARPAAACQAVRRARSARAACSGTASAGTTSTSAWMTPPGSPPSRSSPMVGQTTAGFLERALEHYRELGIRARRVLTDNGSAYSSRAFAIDCRRVHPALGTTPLARLGSRARTTSWLSTPNARASASNLAASMWTPHPPRRRWECQDDTEQAAAGLAGRPRRTPSSTER